jgi:hypothetical protein
MTKSTIFNRRRRDADLSVAVVFEFDGLTSVDLLPSSEAATAWLIDSAIAATDNDTFATREEAIAAFRRDGVLVTVTPYVHLVSAR